MGDLLRAVGFLFAMFIIKREAPKSSPPARPRGIS